MMFQPQGPKDYIAQICEVHLQAVVWKQYNKMAVLHFFRVNTTLIYILFSLVQSAGCCQKFAEGQALHFVLI